MASQFSKYEQIFMPTPITKEYLLKCCKDLEATVLSKFSMRIEKSDVSVNYCDYWQDVNVKNIDKELSPLKSIQRAIIHYSFFDDDKAATSSTFCRVRIDEISIFISSNDSALIDIILSDYMQFVSKCSSEFASSKSPPVAVQIVNEPVINVQPTKDVRAEQKAENRKAKRWDIKQLVINLVATFLIGLIIFYLGIWYEKNQSREASEASIPAMNANSMTMTVNCGEKLSYHFINAVPPG